MKVANQLFLLNIFVITTVTTIEVYNIIIVKIGIMNIINMNNGKKLLRPLASRRALFDYINGFDFIGPNPIYC
jgi:hypothetical protein